MSKLGWFGVVVTVLYLGGVTLFQWNKLTGLSDLQLGNFGDFLAGTFGPVAIFWLVLGFFQQGAELRNSVKSLDLQTRELRESVKQQKELARISNDQFELQQKEFNAAIQRLGESLQPKFIVSYMGFDDPKASAWDKTEDLPLQHRLAFANVGGTACEVELSIAYGTLEPEEGPIVIWPQFEVRYRQVDLFASDTHGDSIKLNLNYKDSIGNSHTFECFFVRVSHGACPKFEIQGLAT